MAKLLSKEETKTFGSITELRDFNTLQEKSYSWVEYDTVDGEYVPLEDNPICIPIIRDDLQISKDVTDETISDQMEDTKLALKYPSEHDMKCYPVGPTAYRGVLERVGGTCPALTSLKETRSRNEVSPTDKAAICNMLTKYTKGKSLLLVGDELVLADLSSDYVRLPFSDLLDITEKELSDKFEYVRYVQGTVSHESSSAEFLFQDNETDSNLLDAFGRIGIDTTDYNAHIKVLTSDVGLSGANIYPFIRSEKTGNQISIGTPIKLEHIGSADMDKFKTNLLSCFASFMECSEHLDEMERIKISNPADTVYNIGHKVGLPEKLIKEAYEDFNSEFAFSCKGTDIYVKLFDVLDTYVSDENVSDIRQMQLNENITRICFYSLTKFDMPAF
ncbi:hypothetical protein [Butyrivibrio sp. AC2005]|uniref:hypothetical protein n=1 Tax=Butyrivibrio sp. AC2005 TaxID=1280672 RepID=UPI000419C52E|nr:hypothetical protein [Butyrivibrio sp. AC2005]